MTKKYIKDIALSKLLGIPLGTIRDDRLKNRRIPFIKLGGSVLYSADDCVAALDKLTLGGPQPVRR